MWIDLTAARLFQVSSKKDFNAFDSTTNLYHDTNEGFWIFVKALRDGESSFFSKLSFYVPYVFLTASVVCDLSFQKLISWCE